MSESGLGAVDAAHHLHPFTDPERLRANGPLVMHRGEGVFVEDTSGRRYLDGMAGLWCVQVGYGRRELIDAATRQLEELAFYNTFFGTTTAPVARLVDELRALTPDGLDRFVFANSGSEAIDTAVRLVRHYWALEGRPERNIVIGRDFGYHGSTMAAASVGGMAGMHAQGGLPLPDFAHVMPPYQFELGRDESPEAFGLRAARALDAKIREVGAERVAAFFAEPVMGAGGVIVPPSTYWPEVQRICREHDVLLLADEVICGFGRTGAWWGSQIYGIEPDLVTMAKGITSGYVPLSALALGDRVGSVLARSGVLQHGFTYSGHPVAAAVALANLEVLRSERLPERVAEQSGPQLQSALGKLRDHPIVGEVRGVGLLGGIELVADRESMARFEPAGSAAPLCRELALEEGLIVRALRDGVYVSPPLTIAPDEIDTLVSRLTRALDRTAERLAR